MVFRYARAISFVVIGGVCLITTTMISCGGGDGVTPTSPTSTTSINVKSIPLSTIATIITVSASMTSLTVGETATVTATATYSNGTSAEITPTWSSSASEVATVSTSGTVTAVVAGTTTITGTFSGENDSVEITVNETTALESVEVLYDSGAPIAGFQFKVTGVDVTDAGGGAAEANGFSVSTGNNIVIGFSFAGATIPSGEGVLVILDVEGSSGACLTDLIISDSSGNALDSSVENCLTISVP